MLEHSRLTTANALFKAKYRKYLDIAMSISLSVHLLAFAVVPHIEINPHKTELDELEVIEIPPEIEIPPPPKEIQRPKIPIETLDEEVEEEDTIEDTTFNPDDLPDAPPPPPPGGGDWLNFDKPPKPRRTPFSDADYPTMARTTEIEGTVLLKVTIDERGKVIFVTVLQSDSPMFNDAAKNVVKRWEFAPAEFGGSPVKSTITIPLRFTLNR
jgi:protein TonB